MFIQSNPKLFYWVASKMLEARSKAGTWRWRTKQSMQIHICTSTYIILYLCKLPQRIPQTECAKTEHDCHNKETQRQVTISKQMLEKPKSIEIPYPSSPSLFQTQTDGPPHPAHKRQARGPKGTRWITNDLKTDKFQKWRNQKPKMKTGQIWPKHTKTPYAIISIDKAGGKRRRKEAWKTKGGKGRQTETKRRTMQPYWETYEAQKDTAQEGWRQSPQRCRHTQHQKGHI